MTKQQKETIEEYIRRAISDIAKKCRVSNDEVTLVMSEFIPCELKQCEASSHEDDYVVVEWPEIQYYMEEEGFCQKACLANSDEFIDMYGSSAYFVSKPWLDEVLKKIYEEEQADAYLSSIEAHEKI